MARTASRIAAWRAKACSTVGTKAGCTPRWRMPEKIQKIDHIGIAVPDLEAAIQMYTALFVVGPTSVEAVPEQEVRTAFFHAGESLNELLCPTASDSPISTWLAKRGGGIHHLCLSVPDIEPALGALAALGMQLIDSTPRIGAHGKRIAFVHPKALGGVLLELSEAPHLGCGRAHPCPLPRPRLAQPLPLQPP